MRRILFAVFLVVACATGAAADSFDDANSAYQREDFALAVRLFRPLAEQGNAGAQYNLGMMHAKGQSVPKDYREAAKWFQLAAEQGDARAQYNLGWMSTMGFGVQQNDQEALKWYRRAAEQGNAHAHFGLGKMYEKGHGVPPDFVRSHMWYSVAATVLSGAIGKAAITNRDLAASRMTAAQIGKAQEMARHCQETKFKECD